jgi:hypothetical protein
MIMATVLVGMVIVALTKTIQSSGTSAQMTTAHNTLAMKLARTVESLRRELSFAALSTCRAVPPGGTTDEPMADGVTYDNVTFRPVTSFVDADPQYGDAVRYSLTPERGEIMDGVDNDHDGIVDERVLMRTVNGFPSALLTGVVAFSMVRHGPDVTVTIRIAARNQLTVIVKNASLTTSMMNN